LGEQKSLTAFRALPHLLLGQIQLQHCSLKSLPPEKLLMVQERGSGHLIAAICPHPSRDLSLPTQLEGKVYT